MLDNKEIEIIKRNMKRFINDNLIVKEKQGKFIDFFMKNSADSLNSAKLLFKASTNKELQNYSGFPDFNGFLWVINSSYYSMFYMARALLESEGIKNTMRHHGLKAVVCDRRSCLGCSRNDRTLKGAVLVKFLDIKIKQEMESIHLITFDALVYYFYLTGKIEKSLIEEFKEAEKEVSETLGKDKARGLIEDYSYERDKRSRFTYEMGEIAIKNKAETSLNRAMRFNEEIRKIIEFKMK